MSYNRFGNTRNIVLGPCTRRRAMPQCFRNKPNTQVVSHNTLPKYGVLADGGLRNMCPNYVRSLGSRPRADDAFNAMAWVRLSITSGVQSSACPTSRADLKHSSRLK